MKKLTKDDVKAMTPYDLYEQSTKRATEDHLPTDAAKEVLELMTYAELGEFFTTLQNELAEYESRAKRLKRLAEVVTDNIIPTKLEEDDFQNVPLKSLGKRWQVRHEMRCSVKSGEKEHLFDWLRENGHESLISETVNSSTLKAFYKEQSKAGNATPDDMLNLHFFERANLVKS